MLQTGKTLKSIVHQKVIKICNKPTEKWGSASVLVGIDVSTLSRGYLIKHLEARNEDSKGNKKKLIARLEGSLEQEITRGIAYAKELEEKHCQIATLEEMGLCCYAVGCNSMGQLGLGDVDDRDVFTIIPMTRGLRVTYVASGYNLSFAVTEDCHVYTWGGSLGIATGIDPLGTKTDIKDYSTPRIIPALEEEEIIMTSIGSSHACALSKGGDCFVWGYGKFGALGLESKTNKDKPTMISSFQENDVVANLASGEHHTCALMENGDVYAWGDETLGLPGVPTRIPKFNQVITRVACGAQHTLAVGLSRVYSWGSGNGGRLGQNDYIDRSELSPIETLDGLRILDISAGTWHSSCVILVPPLRKAGMVYTWGSGQCGQLGQGDAIVSLIPKLVTGFLDTHIFIKLISCGSYHNAAITQENELYTWGSNKHGCLGRKILVDQATTFKNSSTNSSSFLLKTFTPYPGHVGGYGAIVNRIGRGLVKSVSCGKHFTIVTTLPYTGPNKDMAQKLMEEEERKQKKKELQIQLDHHINSLIPLEDNITATATTTTTATKSDNNSKSVSTNTRQNKSIVYTK